MESQFIEEEALWIQTGITGEKDDNIWSDRWIALKASQLFLEAVFLVLPMESLLVEDDLMSPQTGIKAEKGHNFWSDRWIALKVLQ